MIKMSRVVELAESRSKLIHQIKYFEDNAAPIQVHVPGNALSIFTSGLVKVKGESSRRIRDICINNWNEQVDKIEDELRAGGIEP